VGGISEIYLTEIENKATLTAVSGVITAFTLSSGKKFWTFKLEKENAEFTEKIVPSVENGTVYYEQEVKFSMKQLSASNRNNIRQIVQNRLFIIVKDNNGVYWLLGEVNGCDLGASDGKTGKAMGDLNGYSLTFMGKEPAPAQQVTGTLLATLTV
jgi:predicted aspartyl protease